ncbi:MAG: hypothetical protein LC129_11835, partial [Burkholderiales bacterium]|nr:hypothetical protein [Burkholderiales bacterium]
MTAPEPDASTPPAPRPATPQQRDGGSLPPPAGSKGYRALGDPPPRGHPLTSPPPRGASRGSSPAPTPQPQRSSGQATPGVVDSPKVPPASPVQPAIAQPVEPPDEPPTAGPESGDDVPGQPPADHRRLILLLAVVASLLVHGALAWWSRNQPLGHIDPTLIRQERQLFRVQRAQRDMILDGGAGLAPGGVSSAAAQPDNPRSPLTDLGLSMLNAEPSSRPQPMGAGQNGAPDIAPQAKPFSDHRPHETGPSPAAGAPATQLPASIRDQMFVDIPLATQYVGQGGQGSAATGQGSGDGVAPTGGEGSGQGQASSMLAQAGRSGATPANPKLPDLAAPALVDKPDLSDKRPADQALTPQPIDLSAITAQAATQLAIPEHLDNDFDYAVTRYIPKGGWGVSREEERGYFRVDITGKRSLRRLQTMPKDMVYLIDISGSVSQDWVDHTLRGVRDSLASLNPGDRFNIVYFADKPAILSSQGILPANDENFEKARQ